MELHCERVLCIFVCHTQLLSIWLLAWIISEFSFKSLFSFSHSIIVYPKPRKVSYTHTLGTQIPCFLSVTDYPQNLVETNNPIKYFIFDKTGNIAIIHLKKKKFFPDLFTTACSWLAAQNYYHSISTVCLSDFIQLIHAKTTAVLSTFGL